MYILNTLMERVGVYIVHTNIYIDTEQTNKYFAKKP